MSVGAYTLAYGQDWRRWCLLVAEIPRRQRQATRGRSRRDVPHSWHPIDADGTRRLPGSHWKCAQRSAEAQSGGDSTLPTSEPHAIPSYTPNGEPYDHRETEVTLLASDLAGELEGLDGYAGIVISDDEVSFTINWQGVPPDEVVLALARAASAGIDARLSSVDYTSTYLDRLAYAPSLLADPTVEQTWLLSASAAPDASGLVVGTVAVSQLHTLSSPEVADLLGIPVPVTVEVGGTTGDGSDFLRPDG